jgi:hypothetical protein
VCLLVLFVAIAFSYAGYFSIGVRSQNRKQSVERLSATAQRPRYSDFNHATKAHAMECASCHKFPSSNWNKVRAGADAFPDITDYPKHESCVGCHKQQFFKGRPPTICSNCHTNPGPRDSSRHPFPNPREIFDKSPKGRRVEESDFAISFPHDKHIDIVSGDGDPSYKPSKGEESCAVCHKTYQPQSSSPEEFFTKPPANNGDAFWLKKGTFKTVPTGHTVCFSCHSQDSGLEPTPVNCAACHKLRPSAVPADFDPKLAAKMNISDKIMLTAWRHRASAGAFRHEFEMHSGMDCATCHTVATMNTLDIKTRKVPVSSCATCHATATLDDGGVLNYEVDKRKKDAGFQCVKCHIAYGKLPIPNSHLKALEAAK